jgi:hypothetical protein
MNTPATWTQLLQEAVSKPGLLLKAYSAFHNYSVGNQLLAIVQCGQRGLEPGPLSTFPGWIERGCRELTHTKTGGACACACDTRPAHGHQRFHQ